MKEAREMPFHPISGHHCATETAGNYTCPKCGEKLSIKRGEVFPNCRRDKSAVRWLSAAPDEPEDLYDDDDDDDD